MKENNDKQIMSSMNPEQRKAFQDSQKKARNVCRGKLTIGEEYNKKIMSLLDPDQKEAFEEFLKRARHDRRKEYMRLNYRAYEVDIYDDNQESMPDLNENVPITNEDLINQLKPVSKLGYPTKRASHYTLEDYMHSYDPIKMTEMSERIKAQGLLFHGYGTTDEKEVGDVVRIRLHNHIFNNNYGRVVEINKRGILVNIQYHRTMRQCYFKKEDLQRATKKDLPF